MAIKYQSNKNKKEDVMSKTKSKNNKQDNLGEVTITIDDASAHLLGMIDEQETENKRRFEIINAAIEELKLELASIKNGLKND